MDRLEALGRAHVDVLVAHEEIAALDDLDAHLAGEVGVLEVGGVVGAGGQQHDRRFGHAGGCCVVEHFEQFGRIILHRAHAAGLEDLGEGAFQGAAVLQHITDPGGAAGVVLEHKVVTLGVADDVGAADMDVDVARHLHVYELAPEMFRRHHVVGRDGAVVEDVLLVVDVVQKEVQRGDALHESRLDPVPFVGRDDARHQIEGKDPLGTLRIAIDVEGHALAQKGEVDRAALGLKLRRGDRPEMLEKMPVMRPHRPVGPDHLVKELPRGIPAECSGKRGGRRGGAGGSHAGGDRLE